MSRRDYVSASQIDTANYCIMKYYLKYMHPNKPKPLRLSAYVKGGLLHKLIEEFWKRLGTEEEVWKDKKDSKKKATEKKKYFDAESFGKYSQGRWTSLIIAAKNAKDPQQKIYWREGYEDNSEAWEIQGMFPKICSALFKELVKEEPPLYSELPFYFELSEMKFKGFIDEVRLRDDRIVIRDYKSGYPWGIKEMKRDFDPQLTFYNAGLCSLCFDNEEFAKSLGLENIRHQFMGNPIYIYHDFEEEFFMVEAPFMIEKANTPPPEIPLKQNFWNFSNWQRAYGKYREELGAWKEKKKKFKTLPTIIHSTNRNDEHFFQLVEMINKTKRAVQNGDITFESGKKCDICDMKLVCREEAKKIGKPGELKDKKGNKFFSFMEPPYTKPVELQPKEFTNPSRKQKIFDYRKKEPWKGRF